MSIPWTFEGRRQGQTITKALGTLASSRTHCSSLCRAQLARWTDETSYRPTSSCWTNRSATCPAQLGALPICCMVWTLCCESCQARWTWTPTTCRVRPQLYFLRLWLCCTKWRWWQGLCTFLAWQAHRRHAYGAYTPERWTLAQPPMHGVLQVHTLAWSWNIFTEVRSGAFNFVFAGGREENL